MNQINITGNLTADCELRTLKTGTSACKFTLASNRKYKVGEELKEEVCFVDCKLYGKYADTMSPMLTKGAKVFVSGRLSQESWTDQANNKKSKHVIAVETVELLASRQSGASAGITQPNKSNVTNPPTKPSTQPTHIDPPAQPGDDDVPF